MKNCSTCRQAKPFTEFNRCKANKDGLQYKCRSCTKAASDSYDYSERDKIRWQQYQEWMDSLKAVPCLDCGGSFPPECMDFDHRPEEIKICEVSGMMTHTRQRVLDEVAKCDIICSNCHRIRTKNRRLVNG